jgi:hypothetical protein
MDRATCFWVGCRIVRAEHRRKMPMPRGNDMDTHDHRKLIGNNSVNIPRRITNVLRRRADIEVRF